MDANKTLQFVLKEKLANLAKRSQQDFNSEANLEMLISVTDCIAKIAENKEAFQMSIAAQTAAILLEQAMDRHCKHIRVRALCDATNAVSAVK